jgi:periplasmic protein TonB
VEPKEVMKQQQPDRPKQETPPEPAPLKMAGPAGDGPSPFQAGEVKSDYVGGDIGNGAAFTAYVGRVAQLIQDELAKRKARVDGARVFLWLKPDGSVDRYEIRNARGDVEKVLRATMDDLGRVPDAPPADLPMPMGLDISER